MLTLSDGARLASQGRRSFPDVAKRQSFDGAGKRMVENAPFAEISGYLFVFTYIIGSFAIYQNNFHCVVILEFDVANRQLSGYFMGLDKDTQGAAFIGRAENWEAGQNPALPPQRWWSETSAKGHWRNPGRRRDSPKGRLQSPETSLVTKLMFWLRRAAGR
ncbi:hypothetical protein ASG68_01275 [Rhizobium sp. Leaf453]|nr:hypothetical protein ASG50_04105 [Rhizobium sp. Leaf386]KQT06096.1 hypothetical protein ASG42_00350 [Rhizobium sp. Leaf391]KQU09669.1 hypothetical protein ASG68_01275 [Rhizobium sp. Leaf453]